MKKRINKKAQKVFGKYERYFYALAVVLAFSVYILMPGCGGNKANNNANVIPQTCLPGQICTGPYTTAAQGIPLLNGPTVSYLDQQGSQIILTWAAPQYNAGQAYSGSVNVTGTIRLAPGSCYGMPGGEYQVQGQGVWQSGYAGAVAAVQAQLQVVGGGYAQQQQPYNPYGGYGGYNPYQPTQYPYGQPQTGGTVNISQALIHSGGQGGYGSYTLGDTYGIYVSMCNRTFVPL